MAKRDFVTLLDFTPEELLEVIDKAIYIKKNPDEFRDAMKQKTLMMIFQKPSLRTRVSFEVGMTQMGGHAIYYNVATSPL
ncbi:ornithine carbamoyltransferase, partial [Candidatus Woesearchaeota archaeon]